jgi:hypothetical protein
MSALVILISSGTFWVQLSRGSMANVYCMVHAQKYPLFLSNVTLSPLDEPGCGESQEMMDRVGNG